MQSATTVSDVPFRQTLRRGQQRTFERPEVLTGIKLNVKLPTGYGKTFTAAGVYSIRQHHQLASRLLYVVPSTAQLDQFMACGPQDLGLASVEGPRIITDIGFTPEHKILQRHRRNECQVFVSTIQYLYQGGFNTALRLLEQGQWMAVIDEYQHYGIEKEWGKKVLSLPFSFLLAMSATPYRPKSDSAFGLPHVSVTYREGVDEGVLKPLMGHAYDYRIDLLDDKGELHTYVTSELIAEVGSDNPDAIEHFRIKRKMRWSPKYVSPLASMPIDRMLTERQTTGRHRLQALISAMCVSHAELVCSQLKSYFPELNIDWVGTGEFGRSPAKNAEILAKFCPPKSKSYAEKRPEPELDVLVHVGMAGEGLDAPYISESVFLRSASFSNQTLQIAGRAGRPLRDTKGQLIEANISFDGSTELSHGIKINGESVRAVGRGMIDAMDLMSSKETNKEDNEDDDGDDFPPELPPEPAIHIHNMELIGIDSGNEGVRHMAKVMRTIIDPATGSEFISADVFSDPQHADWVKVIAAYKMMRVVEDREYDEKAIVAQWKESVSSALSNATSVALALMRGKGVRIEKSLVGDVKTRINQRKKASIGAISADVETYKLHYQWLYNLSQQLRTDQVLPSWLR